MNTLKIFQILTLFWVVIATVNAFDCYACSVFSNLLAYNAIPILGWGVYYIVNR